MEQIELGVINALACSQTLSLITFFGNPQHLDMVSKAMRYNFKGILDFQYKMPVVSRNS